MNLPHNLIANMHPDPELIYDHSANQNYTVEAIQVIIDDVVYLAVTRHIEAVFAAKQDHANIEIMPARASEQELARKNGRAYLENMQVSADCDWYYVATGHEVW